MTNAQNSGQGLSDFEPRQSCSAPQHSNSLRRWQWIRWIVDRSDSLLWGDWRFSFFFYFYLFYRPHHVCQMVVQYSTWIDESIVATLIHAALDPSHLMVSQCSPGQWQCAPWNQTDLIGAQRLSRDWANFLRTCKRLLEFLKDPPTTARILKRYLQ